MGVNNTINRCTTGKLTGDFRSGFDVELESFCREHNSTLKCRLRGWSTLLGLGVEINNFHFNASRP